MPVSSSNSGRCLVRISLRGLLTRLTSSVVPAKRFQSTAAAAGRMPSMLLAPSAAVPARKPRRVGLKNDGMLILLLMPAISSSPAVHSRLDPERTIPCMIDVCDKAVDGVLRRSTFDCFEHFQMLTHDGPDVTVDAKAILTDQPHLDRVHAVGVRNDGISKGIDKGIVHAPVDRLGAQLQFVRAIAVSNGVGDIAMLLQQPGDRLVRGRAGEERYGLLLQEHTQLERFANEVQVDVGDLQAPLRHGLDQPFGFEPRDELADGAERQSRQFHETALRNELAGTHVTRKQVARETCIGLFPQRRLLVRTVHRLLQHHVRPMLLSTGKDCRKCGRVGPAPRGILKRAADEPQARFHPRSGAPPWPSRLARPDIRAVRPRMPRCGDRPCRLRPSA
ncbi:hypothetical protein RHECNPAF_9300109 [Rhizobium etli CNPAF512]|nr:hypothetical protein RHECNPAF_9300109 [Rhizobium etli CNPAF512]